MKDSVLVPAEWLAQHLNDPKVRVVEVAQEKETPDYAEGHIPGAVRWYWKEALWHPADREFPTPEMMAERLGKAGIGPDTTLVLYSGRVQYGTYAFWALAMCGHPGVRLLDGGAKRWKLEGRPLTKEVPGFPPVSYPPRKGDPSSRIGRDGVRAGLKDARRLLLDVRAGEEYRGERVRSAPGPDHGAERAGRIPGAVHLFFRELLNADDAFKPEGELRALMEGVGARPERETVVYCRLSHRASLAWFAMKHLLGHKDVKVYDGSWTEWGSIVGFPVER